ncbi:tetratricopeptide repeat protein 5 [Lynx pardinus]|nr:tetratricopeptide repeat protein 5 [Felis catus]XP_007091445.1 tetratricopeptide repeat protein 5 isoform X2 [Panthera tigris]XP_042798488.1 tetratricopeptide repeat protein 5 isoform X2 [Panthera leo]XP_043410106.1 tetratricopeptide repeat protein 5 [Prionailurus bengalensis]XP_047718685.1 tetratricopeptide repeat protein 5 isoform X2 [Prionailurus viverrinus]XP_049469170.1 tetratricopeptide repeat protein 5 [Panthera uncia]VFV32169.1 tetratricopeptide repeat protein 5 [Lynx pardinus]
MMADEDEEVKQILQKLQELVDQLYSFRECYFETHGVEDAGRKQQDVREEMEKTLQQMEEVVGSAQGKAQVLMLTGKALNVTPDYSPKAEELLSKAVKLEPKLVEAWNQLGEVYWKKGDIASAHTCFSGALTHCKNKVSLQNLSMVLRQLRTDTGDEHSRHVMDSVRQAKLAVQMDVHDGRSWYILGNAYLSLYFNTGQNPKISQQALSAYAQAEKVDRMACSNPDLHLNRATLHKYEENYGEALEGFSRAAALDPAWPEPRQREQQLLEFLNRLTSLLESKGKVKTKKLQSMLGSLRPAHLGPCGDGRYQSASGQKLTLELKPLSALQPGVNSGAVVLGKVVFSLTTEEKVPFTFGLVDSDGPCCAVMVYNMVQSWGVLIGDSVAIPEPNLRLHRIQHKGKDYSFCSIRVETPLLLVVNGKPQGSSSQAAATVASRPQCE